MKLESKQKRLKGFKVTRTVALAGGGQGGSAGKQRYQSFGGQRAWVLSVGVCHL